MAKTATIEETVARLLDAHGRTFCEEIGIPIEEATPQALFQWMVASLLFSARIGHNLAIQATRALIEAGYTTPEAMAEATWEERVRVLNANGYARYDESTSRMLQETCDRLLQDYGGDLNALREAADRDPGKERDRLKAFKGIGDVGVDIFFREVQGFWDELFPFADKLALRAAKRHGLGEDAGALADLVPREEFPRFVAALTRDELEG